MAHYYWNNEGNDNDGQSETICNYSSRDDDDDDDDIGKIVLNPEENLVFSSLPSSSLSSSSSISSSLKLPQRQRRHSKTLNLFISKIEKEKELSKGNNNVDDEINYFNDDCIDVDQNPFFDNNNSSQLVPQERLTVPRNSEKNMFQKRNPIFSKSRHEEGEIEDERIHIASATSSLIHCDRESLLDHSTGPGNFLELTSLSNQEKLRRNYTEKTIVDRYYSEISTDSAKSDVIEEEEEKEDYGMITTENIELDYSTRNKGSPSNIKERVSIFSSFNNKVFILTGGILACFFLILLLIYIRIILGNFATMSMPTPSVTTSVQSEQIGTDENDGQLDIGGNIESSSTEIRRKHIVIFYVDDQGWNDIGYNKKRDSNRIKSPFIDSLAENGILLSNYYTQSKCTPSRAALLTGQYPMRLGLYDDIIQTTSSWGVFHSENLPSEGRRTEVTDHSDMEVFPFGENDDAHGNIISKNENNCNNCKKEKMKKKTKKKQKNFLTTFPHILKTYGGYYTHGVGKWHLGHGSKYMYPSYNGFDTFYGYVGGAIEPREYTIPQQENSSSHFAVIKDLFYNEVLRQPIFPNEEISERTEPKKENLTSTEKSNVKYIEKHKLRFPLGQNQKYHTQLFTEQAKKIIKSHALNYPTSGRNSKEIPPLFLYVALPNVHRPFTNISSLLESFGYDHTQWKDEGNSVLRELYRQSVLSVDHSVKEIVKTLDTADLLKDSILLYASDNGGCFQSGGYNNPYRGTKSTNFEGGVKTPAFVYLPGKDTNFHKLENRIFQPGQYQGLFHVVDIMPTLLESVGLLASPTTSISCSEVDKLPSSKTNCTSLQMISQCSDLLKKTANETEKSLINCIDGKSHWHSIVQEVIFPTSSSNLIKNDKKMDVRDDILLDLKPYQKIIQSKDSERKKLVNEMMTADVSEIQLAYRYKNWKLILNENKGVRTYLPPSTTENVKNPTKYQGKYDLIIDNDSDYLFASQETGVFDCRKLNFPPKEKRELMRTNGFKRIRHFEDGRDSEGGATVDTNRASSETDNYLFDLATDPYETRNLYHERQDMVDILVSRVKQKYLLDFSYSNNRIYRGTTTVEEKEIQEAWGEIGYIVPWLGNHHDSFFWPPSFID